MSDPKETIYAACPHTVAKHRILQAYLTRWLAILDRNAQKIGRSSQRLLYVDGFAGAGEYEDGVPGSPQIPIDIVANQSHQFACPIEMRFIEKRSDRAAHLRQLIRDKKAKLVGTTGRLQIIDPVEGDCEQEIRRLVSECEARRQALGPAFFFLDQFGYSSFSMDLIQTILRHEVCETFSYLNWNLLHPFMADATKHAGISKAFGGSEWREVLTLSGSQKETRFREVYLAALRERAGARYAYPFAMRGPDHRVIYWLFFCTNNLRGLEEMKEAMWEVDRSGGFEFSDKFASERSSLYEYTDAQLATDLVRELDGQSMTVEQLKEYVLVNTPAICALRAFGAMEAAKQLRPIDPPPNRKVRSFGQHMRMKVRIKEVRPEAQATFFSE